MEGRGCVTEHRENNQIRGEIQGGLLQLLSPMLRVGIDLLPELRWKGHLNGKLERTRSRAVLDLC